MEIKQIREKLIELGDKERAEGSKKYLKSPHNFYGNKIPDLRNLSKEFKSLDFYSSLNLADEMWKSGNHEEMWLALYILTFKVKEKPIEIWDFMMKRLDKANSWDLTDEMSGHVLGPILAERIDLISEVKKLSESRNPWIRRISIISTLPLIKKNKIELTMRLAEKLIYDDDIYVQKGAGWMLREAGKKNRLSIREFILTHMDMKAYAFSYATEKMLELRQIKKDRIKNEKEKSQIVIKDSKIHGKGVFANKNFKKGEVVIKWYPRKVSKEEINKLSTYEKKNIIYLDGEYLLMQEPENKINHSCKPNTKVKDFCDIAIKSIKKGEEITSDYTTNLPEGEILTCNCGSKSCREIIKGKNL
jgi:3-methyladenine DNA glycosylase AlkD